MSAREILADVILDESGNSPNGIADRILADKRIAVVELPAQSGVTEVGGLPLWRLGARWVRLLKNPPGVLVGAGCALDPQETRTLAAMMLAAANAAEATR